MYNMYIYLYMCITFIFIICIYMYVYVICILLYVYLFIICIYYRPFDYWLFIIILTRYSIILWLVGIRGWQTFCIQEFTVSFWDLLCVSCTCDNVVTISIIISNIYIYTHTYTYTLFQCEQDTGGCLLSEEHIVRDIVCCASCNWDL